MNYLIALYAGAFLACIILSRIIWLFARGWPASIAKVLTLDGLATVISILLASLGFQDGGSPQIALALIVYLPCMIAITIFDLIRFLRKDVQSPI